MQTDSLNPNQEQVLTLIALGYSATAAAGETIRVLECFFPSWQVAVLTGTNKDRTVTRVIAPVDALQLVCRVAKAPPGVKPVPITFVTPRTKSA